MGVYALRWLPVDRSYPAPLLVVVEVAPGPSASRFAVQERIPQGWSARTSDIEGMVDAASGWIRWGPFFDRTPRTLRYELSPVAGETPDSLFDGVLSVDCVNSRVLGTLEIPLFPKSRHVVRVLPRQAGAGFVVEVTAAVGTTVTMESSDDLRTWIPVRIWSGQGPAQAEFVALGVDVHRTARFWRFR